MAIIELVKNSYDAFASRVDVRFVDDGKGKLCLEIEDDGVGMDSTTIDDVLYGRHTISCAKPKEHKGEAEEADNRCQRGLGLPPQPDLVTACK
ncbi:MAG: ATP-binding protein [Flavobacteriales bacterium]|nr:ATP-binding protein [Flavobacteriales bacterium]